MTEDKYHDLDLRTLTNTMQIKELVGRIDSHFENAKLRDSKIFDKLEQMPDEDRIVRLFATEGRILAGGLIKKDDEQQEALNNYQKELSNLKAHQKYWAGILIGISWVIQKLS